MSRDYSSSDSGSVDNIPRPLSPAAWLQCWRLRCASQDCGQRARLWPSFLGKTRGVTFDGRWYCTGECLLGPLITQTRGLLAGSGRERSRRHRVPLGLLLVHRGSISPRQLREALRAQSDSSGQKLGCLLRRMGVVAAEELTAALAHQWGCPVFPLDPQTPILGCQDLLPLDLLESVRAVPVYVSPGGRSLHLAFGERLDHTTLYAIERMLHCRAIACVADESAVASLLEQLHRGPSESVSSFDTMREPREIAWTIRSFAGEYQASQITLARASAYIWVRFASAHLTRDLLFRIRPGPQQLASAASFSSKALSAPADRRKDGVSDAAELLMTAQIRTVISAPSVHSRFAAEEMERRKTRLMGVLSQGLPTLPNYVLDLNVLLGQPVVDLKKVGNVIRTDPSLASQVLRLCNSALFGLRHRVISIEQAAILLGTERLRTLILTCSVMQFAGNRVPKAQLSIFWHHSFLCALLSERLAAQLHYCEKEQAYLGGLLHDIGQLPMWMLVLAEEENRRTPPPKNWADDVPLEREYFGMDHCKVGRWMGVSWNYMPSFIDVFEYHHAPEKALHDPYLVGIVAAADQFLIAQANAVDSHLVDNKGSTALPADPNESSAATPGSPAAIVLPFLEKCLPELVESERNAVMEMLQTEYLQLLPLVQLGMTVAAADGV